jgi:hypothetical protein
LGWLSFPSLRSGWFSKDGQSHTDLSAFHSLSLSLSLRPEDAKSSLYILRPPGFDVNAEVSLMIAEANSHIDKDEVTSLSLSLTSFRLLTFVRLLGANCSLVEPR